MTDEQRLVEINAMIVAGWGDVPGGRIPENWREIPGPAITGRAVRVEIDKHVMFIDPLTLEGLPTPQGDIYPEATMDQDAACALRSEIERMIRAKVTHRAPKGRPKGSKDTVPRSKAMTREVRLAAFRLRQERRQTRKASA